MNAEAWNCQSYSIILLLLNLSPFWLINVYYVRPKRKLWWENIFFISYRIMWLMVSDFDTICVIQAWASPQKEGTIPKEKVGLLLIFKGRCFVSFHHIHHGQWMGSAIHESGIWEIKNSWSFVWDDTDRVWRNEENSDNSRSLWTGDLKHILLIPKPIPSIILQSVINCQRIYESDDKCFTMENSKIYMMWLR